MTLTIELPPDLENRLRQEAEKHGVDAGELARRLIERQLPAQQTEPKSLWETLTPDEWERAFDEYLASHDPTKPPLPPEAFERASFYGERG
jgi:hypothetical protein